MRFGCPGRKAAEAFLARNVWSATAAGRGRGPSRGDVKNAADEGLLAGLSDRGLTVAEITLRGVWAAVYI